MIIKLDRENTKQYQALCDFWRLGASRSLNQLHKSYQELESPPVKSYATLKRWYDTFAWEKRIAAHLESEQLLLEQLHQEELVKNAKRQFEIIDDMFQLTQEIEIDVDAVSVAQATGLYKTLLDAINKTFNLGAPDKVALTDPSGKKEYNTDINELLKLANAAKRRPD